MASLKIVLDQRRAKFDGSFPLKIRLFHRGKFVSQSLGVSLLPSQWDEASSTVINHSTQKLFNAKINQQYSKLELMLLDLEMVQTDFTIDDIKVKLKPPKAKSS